MNEYRFEDMYVGLTHSFAHRITDEDMNRFLATTQDNNPLHTDEEYAHQCGFRDRVVYGLLTSSLISTLGGVYLPGKYCIIQQLELKYANPVYVGDTLLVGGSVQELNESVQQAVIKVEIKNQDGKKVVRGKLYVGFLK